MGYPMKFVTVNTRNHRVFLLGNVLQNYSFLWFSKKKVLPSVVSQPLLHTSFFDERLYFIIIFAGVYSFNNSNKKTVSYVKQRVILA